MRQAGSGATLRDAPSREKLEPVLAELGAKGQEGATRWERFKRWLKEKLENRKDDDESSALEKWSRQFQTSEGIAQAITYAGYAMVGVLVLFVIWSELRAAGLLGGVRRARGARQSGGAMATAAHALRCRRGAARGSARHVAAFVRRGADARRNGCRPPKA